MDRSGVTRKIICNRRWATLSERSAERIRGRPVRVADGTWRHRMSGTDPVAVADPCGIADGHRNEHGHVQGYGHPLLPFPAEPGPFLADALKALYGVFLRSHCTVTGADLDLPGLAGRLTLPPLTGSLGYLIG